MTYSVSLVDALRETMGEGAVDYAPGAVLAESLEIVPTSALRPPKGEAMQGPGLLGEYFVGTNHVGVPKLRRIDKTIDFIGISAPPRPSFP